MTDLRSLPVDRIQHRPDARRRSDEALATLEESMGRLGLINPIRVRPFGDGYQVVAGSHRLQAAELLEWREVACIVVSDDDIAAELAMIAENLHRAELSALERDEQIARWVELSGVKFQSAQIAPFESKRDDGRGHRPESGINAASRELGIDRTDAQRAVKVASLSPEAKEAARETGLDNNRSAMLAAAKQSTPQAQVQTIQQHHAQRTGGIAGRYAQPTATHDAAMFDKFVHAVDLIEAMDPDALITAAGRQRAVLGQRASGLADRLSQIMERLQP